jgi:hypothetical protein
LEEGKASLFSRLSLRSTTTSVSQSSHESSSGLRTQSVY